MTFLNSNICLEKKFVQRVSPEKKNSCASSERKKIRASWKFPSPLPPQITFLMVRPLLMEEKRHTRKNIDTHLSPKPAIDRGKLCISPLKLMSRILPSIGQVHSEHPLSEGISVPFYLHNRNNSPATILQVSEGSRIPPWLSNFLAAHLQSPLFEHALNNIQSHLRPLG